MKGRRLAVFIDGEFWHGGQWSRRGFVSLEQQFEGKSQADYWVRKISSNATRDCVNTGELLSKGWTVVRLWEGHILHNLEGSANIVMKALEAGMSDMAPAKLPRKLFADFFAGIGLMRLGLERRGWSAAFANDIDAAKLEMYKLQFPDAPAHFVLGDIHGLHADDVPDVALATASFPCTDLSLAGGRAGLGGPQSSAFWGFITLLRDMGDRRPPLVVLENVPGFLTSHGGTDFHKALTALNELGYAVDAFMVDAAHFVPQSRLRLFVVGSLFGNDQSGLFEQTALGLESDIRPRALTAFILGNQDVNWSHRRLPGLPRPERTLVDIIEDLPPSSSEWWSRTRCEYLYNQMTASHRDRADEMIRGEAWSYGTVFRRMRGGKSRAELRTDGLAGCLRTPKGGSARQILFKAGHGEYHVRFVTPREAARLMGADDYHIQVPRNQALFGFGDAVCVPVVEWVAKHYLDPLVVEYMRGTVLSPDVAGGAAHVGG